MYSLVHIVHFFFFFQAEDGIRDLIVTGVQTCALPISRLTTPIPIGASAKIWRNPCSLASRAAVRLAIARISRMLRKQESTRKTSSNITQIGRASCRERV